jgi:hypothetical protein
VLREDERAAKSIGQLGRRRAVREAGMGVDDGRRVAVGEDPIGKGRQADPAVQDVYLGIDAA